MEEIIDKKANAKIKFVGKTLLIEHDDGKGKLERMLVIGDLHLGFEESLNESGILVTRIMLNEMIKELDEVFAKIRKEEDGKREKIVDKIVLLGDIKHYFGRIARQEWNDVLHLFGYLSEKSTKIIVIRGNHDLVLKPIARKAGLKVRDYWIWGGFCFMHGDKDFAELWRKKKREFNYLIIGHGHPAVTLREKVRTEKYKCFLAGEFRRKKLIILPSFSEWSIGSDAREGKIVLAWKINFDNFNALAVGDNLEVFDFGKLRSIQ